MAKEIVKTTLKVEGMSCAACSNRVEKALQRLEGVETAAVNLATERAVVEHNPKMVSPAQLAEAVEKSGYKAFPDLRKVELKIEGMTCAACSNWWKRPCKGLTGWLRRQ